MEFAIWLREVEEIEDDFEQWAKRLKSGKYKPSLWADVFHKIATGKEKHMFDKMTIPITLYHGTSTAFLKNMHKKGLQPPIRSFDDYAKHFIDEYIKQNPHIDFDRKAVENTVFQHAIERRLKQQANVGKGKNILFLTVDWQAARRYALAYYKTGGEMGDFIYQSINYHACKKMGIDVPDEPYLWFRVKKCVPPIYEKEEAVVVIVEIPLQWMLDGFSQKSTKIKFIEDWIKSSEYAREAWARGKRVDYSGDFPKLVKGKDPYEDFMSRWNNEIIELDRFIPQSMIKEIRPVSKESHTTKR